MFCLRYGKSNCLTLKISCTTHFGVMSKFGNVDVSDRPSRIDKLSAEKEQEGEANQLPPHVKHTHIDGCKQISVSVFPAFNSDPKISVHCLDHSVPEARRSSRGSVLSL